MSSDIGTDVQAVDVDPQSGRFRLTDPQGRESLWGWRSFGPERLPDDLLQTFRPSPNEVDLLFTGDLLFQDKLLHADAEAESLFAPLQPLLRDADLLCGNLEGPLVSDHPSGRFPRYRIPDRWAEVLAGVGFDLLQCANNHLLDAGPEGLSHTAQSLLDAGITPLGLRLDESEPPWILSEIKGIRIGLCAFTYENPPLGKQKLSSLNGLALPPAWRSRVDSFACLGADELAWSESCRRLARQARAMREAGADLLIFCLHWGEEYQERPNRRQEELAKVLAEAGVDLIIGTHPHVVQPLRHLSSSVNPRGCIVYYSLGNFVAAPHRVPFAASLSASGSAAPVEGGVLARVRVRREGGQVRIFSAEALPVACVDLLPGSEHSTLRPHFAVLPLFPGSDRSRLAELLRDGRLNGLPTVEASLDALQALGERILKVTGPAIVPAP
ncbi:MAG: CapA family protein [Clostridiales bacterium]|nr:CapA family protein [Clostridiales bacterium]MDD7432887.1 CapA family protein [Clostridiales bacterium]MDY3061580.1 CapA family protein [Eubacteriales bacterium]